MTEGRVASSAFSDRAKLAAAWLFVGIPMLWGTIMTLVNVTRLFR